MSEDVLKIGKFEFRSRLFTGTGKYPDLDTARKALQASGCEVVTVAVRRVDLKATDADSIMTVLREDNYTLIVSVRPASFQIGKGADLTVVQTQIPAQEKRWSWDRAACRRHSGSRTRR